MATNVLELRRPGMHLALEDREDRVRIRDRRDILGAAISLGVAARSHGLRIMTWHDLATLEPMVDGEGQPLNSGIFDWSEEELSTWRHFEKAQRSPLVRVARVSSEPVLVSRHGIHSRIENHLLKSIARDEFGLGALDASAIVVPVHMPFGQIGAAILTSHDPDRQDLSGAFNRSTELLAPAIARFIRSYVSVTLDGRYMPADTILSRREIECLTWVAQGKTDYEISIILGCSHAGVRYHVGRLCEKLGSVNRAQSVFRACQLGYIGSPGRFTQ